MKIGLQIPSFTWPGEAPAIAPTLARVTADADAAGFDSLWVMDHFFQIRGVGKPEEPMLEGWTALGFMAAHCRRATLGLMVGLHAGTHSMPAVLGGILTIAVADAMSDALGIHVRARQHLAPVGVGLARGLVLLGDVLPAIRPNIARRGDNHIRMLGAGAQVGLAHAAAANEAKLNLAVH